MTEKFEDVIDPDENIEALAEAMGLPIEEKIMWPPLELLNGQKVKVRYLPQSIATSLEFDDGTPVTPPGTRRPLFKYSKWVKEVIPKMNALALKNIQIINDLDKKNQEIPKGYVRLSLISLGEFRRLQNLCFPGATDDSSDSEDEDNAPRGKGRKGIRKDATPAST